MTEQSEMWCFLETKLHVVLALTTCMFSVQEMNELVSIVVVGVKD